MSTCLESGWGLGQEALEQNTLQADNIIDGGQVFLRGLCHLRACLLYGRTDQPDQDSSGFASLKDGQNLMT